MAAARQRNYNGYAVPFLVTQTTTAAPSPSIVSQTKYDELGRVAQTQLTSDLSGTDFVDITYDGIGRILSTSNPYRSTSDATYGITSHIYDAIGRQTLQTQPDGNTLRWTYSGNTVDNYDETGRHWQRRYDTLGRLSAVLEPDSSNNPALETDYQYDSLNDMTRVDQWGGPTGSSGDRARLFNYDRRRRLRGRSFPI